MIFGRNRRIRVPLFGALVAMMTVAGLWNASPARAQAIAEFSLVLPMLIDLAPVSDDTGTVLGTGDFRAWVSYHRTGLTRGDVSLRTPDFTIEIELTALDEPLYQNGDLVGVVLSGRGMAFREGRAEAFAARVTVRGDLMNTASQSLTWDFGDNPVIPGLRADAWGRVKVQFHWDQRRG